MVRLGEMMPYRSQAQRRYFHIAEERGEISTSTVHEFDQASKGKKLPERVTKKKSVHELMKKRMKERAK